LSLNTNGYSELTRIEEGVYCAALTSFIAVASARWSPIEEPSTHLMQDGERARVVIGVRAGFVF
jgi:hypothetical protein